MGAEDDYRKIIHETVWKNIRNIRFLYEWIMGEMGQCVIKAVCEILYEDNLHNNIYNDIYYYTKCVFYIIYKLYKKCYIIFYVI